MSVSSRPLSTSKVQRFIRRAKTLKESDPLQAIETVHQLLDAGVNTLDVFFLQAELLLSLSSGTQAVRAAQSALQVGGESKDTLLLLLESYVSASRPKSVAKLLPHILEVASLSEQELLQVATSAHSVHQYDIAEKILKQLVELCPSDARLYCTLAYINQKLGNNALAVEQYLKSIDLDSRLANAYKSLVSVNKQTQEKNYIDLIERAIPKIEKHSYEYAHVMYALGKTYEDLKNYPKAFQYYSEGATTMLPLHEYHTQATKRIFSITRQYFEHPVQCAVKPVTISKSRKPKPLFIIGMPRTGSTLLDRILSSHSEVVSMGELGCFKESMKAVTGFVGGATFHEFFYRQPERTVDLEGVGKLYMDAACPEDVDVTYFIDKYHANFMDLEFIAKTLPEAKFIHTLRNPMDTCFANFKQLYAPGFFYYSYSLKTCAEYYLLYRDLMNYWHSRLPGRILDVYYEDTISDIKAQTRKVLDFLHLDWQGECIEFYKNKAPVDTASLSQVRQPIYTSAVRHWEKYRPFLNEAIEVFERAGVDVDADYRMLEKADGERILV